MKGKTLPKSASRHSDKESYKTEVPSGPLTFCKISNADIPLLQWDVFRYNFFVDTFRRLKPTIKTEIATTC
jgi:hypothetical protein